MSFGVSCSRPVKPRSNCCAAPTCLVPGQEFGRNQVRIAIRAGATNRAQQGMALVTPGLSRAPEPVTDICREIDFSAFGHLLIAPNSTVH
jgi:hypothetical protein